jgi:glycosyltransferase involved in cell wall biosynthesis
VALRIRFQRTRYPHIGAHAGYVQFVRHLDPARFEVETDSAADGDADLPLVPDLLRHPLRRFVQRRGMHWYKLSDLAAEYRAVRHCASGLVDVVHFLDGEHAPQYLPRWLGALRSRTKVVATYHQPPSLLGGLVRPDVVARLDKVIVVAPEQVAFFRELVGEHRVDLVLHGVDTDFFRPPACRDMDGPLRCVSAGHWLRDWDAFRATARALVADPIRFDVVSEDRVSFNNCPNVVCHHGLDDEGLAELYRASDVLFLPLIDATANNTLLEGMASGLPVVSSDLSGVRTYLLDDAGMLVPGNRVDGSVEALRRLLREPSLRHAMGRAARRRAEQLSWPKVAQRLALIYEQIALPSGVARRSTREREATPDHPLVSVVIPAYNAAGTLPRTLASVCAQTHRAIEVLVVDDGSTDQTANIVLQACRIDPRIRLIRQANLGVAVARNRGIEAAHGAFIAVLDADDLWHPEKLSRQIARFRASSPDTALVSCWKCTIDGDDRLIRTRPLPEERIRPTLRSLLRANVICASAPLMRTRLVREVGGYDPSLRARGAEGAEDLKLYLELASRYRLEVVPEVLVAYRLSPTSMSRRIEQMRRSRHLVLDDLEAGFITVPRRWFGRGRSRADVDAIARLLAAGRWREASSLAAGLLRRSPVSLLLELTSWHGVSFPARLAGLNRRRSKRDVLVWSSAAGPSAARKPQPAWKGQPEPQARQR